MTIDIFTSGGEKKGSMELPASLFGQPVNRGLIHQAVMLQQGNRRIAIAHAKNRHEVSGSTRKLYGQKHTGNARRGSIRSPLLRGGGKAFGPRSERNYTKDMPHSMRRAALFSCLSYQAKKGAIVGLESYPTAIKTKTFVTLLGKMKLAESRQVLMVVPEKHDALWRSSRNLGMVKTLLVSYLNPEDIMHARAIVFVGDALAKAEQLFGQKKQRVPKMPVPTEAVEAPKKSKTAKKPATDVKKKKAAKKSSAAK